MQMNALWVLYRKNVTLGASPVKYQAKVSLLALLLSVEVDL